MKYALTFCGLLLLVACSNQAGGDRRALLHGMYKLYISENQDDAGQWHEDPWTRGGTGFIVYDGVGHMAVQITREGYYDLDWLAEEESVTPARVDEKVENMPPDELKQVVKTFSSSYVYIANYTIEDTADIVAHERISSSIPVVRGTTVRRAFSFSGDTLILRILNVNRRLKWIRQP
jgi:hypothetical protein